MNMTEEEFLDLDINAILNIGLKKEDSLLDLGCGSGRHSIELSRRGFKRLVGLDINNSGLEEANLNAQMLKLPCKFVLGTWYQLPFPDSSFDALLLLHSGIDRLPQELLQEVLGEVGRVMKPDGKVLCDVTNGDKIIQEHTQSGKLVPQVKNRIGWTDEHGNELTCRQNSSITNIQGQWRLNNYDEWIVGGKVTQQVDYNPQIFYTGAQLSQILTHAQLKLKQSLSLARHQLIGSETAQLLLMENY